MKDCITVHDITLQNPAFSIAFTHIHLRINDVDETPKDNDEIEHVPCIPKIILQNKFTQNNALT
jgi:hypothetical protein